MYSIIIEPTDSNAANYAAELAAFEANIDGARKLASPNLVEPITEEDLPTSVLGDPVFLRTAERQVLRDVGMTAAEVSSLPRDSEKFLILLLLLQLRLAINIQPKLPQLLRESVLSYAHDEQWERIGWKERQDELKEQYKDEVMEINPEAEILMDSLPAAVVLLTDSRL